MSIISFRHDDLFSNLPAGAPVPAPIGEPISVTRVSSFEGASGERTGVWECTPGDWRRQITKAEFCTFLEGKAVFEPDEGEPLTIMAGDSLYFPANSLGVWRVEETLRKIYIIFDPA